MSKIILTNRTAPETPSPGKAAVFFDSADGFLKYVDDQGVVRRVISCKPSKYFTPLGYERLSTTAPSAQSQRGVVVSIHLASGARFRKLAYRVAVVQAASPDSCIAIYSYNGDQRLWYADGLDLAPAAGGTGIKTYDFGSVTELDPGNYLLYVGNKDATMSLYRYSPVGIETFNRSHYSLATADGSVSPTTIDPATLIDSVNQGQMIAGMFYDNTDE